MQSKPELVQELLGTTRAEILKALLASDETVRSLSERLSLIEPGVRKHVEYMERIGIVSSFVKREGRGRPKKFYSITPVGRTLFPKLYDRVLELLLKKLSSIDSKNQQNLSEEMLSSLATDLSKEFRARTASLDSHGKLSAFEDFLNELGFSAKVRKSSDGTISITRSDCALYNVASSNFRSVCIGFDGSLVSNCLGVENRVRLENCMALGKRNCIHTVKTSK